MFWNEKDKALKLSIPSLLERPRYLGQVACGVQEFPANGDEMVSQKWVALVSRKDPLAFTCINNGVYGSDCRSGELRITLLRSPAYSGHPIGGREHIVRQDRFTPRIDQGERCFRFWINAGLKRERLEKIDREALFRNEKPFALSFYPSGQGRKSLPGPQLSDGIVQITAMKKSENGNDLILRLFEPTGKKRETILTIPFLKIRSKIKLSGFELKTLRIDLKKRKIRETDLLENSVEIS